MFTSRPVSFNVRRDHVTSIWWKKLSCLVMADESQLRTSAEWGLDCDVGLHSNQKPFSKILHRLMDIVLNKQLRNLANERAETTRISLGVTAVCSTERSRWFEGHSITNHSMFYTLKSPKTATLAPENFCSRESILLGMTSNTVLINEICIGFWCISH